MGARSDRVLSGLLVTIFVGLVGAMAVRVGARWLSPSVMPFAPSHASESSAVAEAHEDAMAPISSERAQAASSAAPSSTLLPLQTKNAIGRSGALFLPRQIADGARPLLVLFHGTGSSGADILAEFRSLAEARGIVVLAPDSGRSPDGNYNWEVPDKLGETTGDQAHVAACLAELFARPEVRIDPERVLAAGHSGGGSSAAYVATNDARFRGFAVLHGGIFEGGLGSNRVPAWFSTGSEDTLRPPALVQSAATAAGQHATTVAVHVYPGGHGLSAVELGELLIWWLGPTSDAPR